MPTIRITTQSSWVIDASSARAGTNGHRYGRRPAPSTLEPSTRAPAVAASNDVPAREIADRSAGCRFGRRARRRRSRAPLDGGRPLVFRRTRPRCRAARKSGRRPRSAGSSIRSVEIGHLYPSGRSRHAMILLQNHPSLSLDLGLARRHRHRAQTAARDATMAARAAVAS